MSTFTEVFERIKQATSTRTQVELAEVLDIRQSSISDAKRRNSVPSDWYMKLFEKYGLNPDWLKHGTRPMYLKSETGYEPHDGPAADKVMEDVSFYAEPESKGRTVTVFSMQGEEEGQKGWKPRKVAKLNIPLSLAKPSIMVVRVDSSAMEPLLRRGAYVGVDTDHKTVLSGELFAVYVPFEGLSVKRVFLDDVNRRFILRTESPGHPEQYLPVGEHAERIIGRVVWVLQEL